MPNKLTILTTLLIWFLPGSVFAAFDHSEWDSLLQQNVIKINEGQTTQVNYAAMLADRARLRSYLDRLAEVQRSSFENWSEDEQLAFLINAYNAWTIELVLTEYPGLDSIREIGFLFSSPWRRKFVSLFGEQMSLDDIEHGMIRGWERYNEPRIHFAVNCAAIGCPALRAEAYEGNRLEEQLEDNTRLFLSDRGRNYFSDGRLYVSSIFNWYQEDFERGWTGIDSVDEFMSRYSESLGLDLDTIAALNGGRLGIRYLRYDWELNRTD